MKVVEGDNCLEILTHEQQWWVRETLHDHTHPALYSVDGDNLPNARALAASVRITHDRTYHGPRAIGQHDQLHHKRP